MMSEEVITSKGGLTDMAEDTAQKMVSSAFLKVMDRHFAKLYSKIDILIKEMSMLKASVASLVEENKKLTKLKGIEPDTGKNNPK